MTLLERLRIQTRPAHEAVERQFGLFDRPWSADQYRDLLRRFLGFYEPLEGRIDAATDWSELGFDWPRRRKTPLLQRDLAALGDRPKLLAALPRCNDLPSAGSLPQALGCLYVLEGATLGGQMVARHLAGVPGLADGAFFSFFSSYGGEVGKMWRAFGAFLTAQVDGEDDVVVGAACDTFTSLGLWLQGSTN